MTALIVNSWTSKCGECNKYADPYEEQHDTQLGYVKAQGCGATFTYLTSELEDPRIREAAMDMRPDLPWVSADDRPVE